MESGPTSQHHRGIYNAVSRRPRRHGAPNSRRRVPQPHRHGAMVRHRRPSSSAQAPQPHRHSALVRHRHPSNSAPEPQQLRTDRRSAAHPKVAAVTHGCRGPLRLPGSRSVARFRGGFRATVVDPGNLSAGRLQVDASGPLCLSCCLWAAVSGRTSPRFAALTCPRV